MMDHLVATTEGMEDNKEKMAAKIDASQEKTKARTVSTQEEMKDMMDIYQEKMETAIRFIWSKLEKMIKYRVEDVLLCVNQKTQGLHKELTEMFDET
jgi:hypothetical protein